MLLHLPDGAGKCGENDVMYYLGTAFGREEEDKGTEDGAGERRKRKIQQGNRE